MSQYLVLSRIQIQNANCIAGFTWGFPAITHYLGFTHAMQRQLSATFDIALGGCAIVSHDYQLRVYKPSPRANFEFLQSKGSYTFKPKFDKGLMKTPSIIEEGKMNLTTSMVIEVSKELTTNEASIKQLKQAVLAHCLKSRFAGGTILSIGRIDLLSASTNEQLNKLTKKLKRLTMPGFVLKDRSEYLKRHFQRLKEMDENAGLLDGWLDFSAMKYQAQPKLKKNELEATAETDADWELLAKPEKGWLVPIMTGYKAISQVYPAGEVANTRDAETPSRFVEAVHTIGEWKSMHRITNINEIIWRYQPDNDWYLCTQETTKKSSQQTSLSEESETLDFQTALSNL
ncbi:MAG: type I-F CRISPR-associated protein Csy2 [Gammaproteobacteria bacterium]|nr:type I-F CRISPR-associated protein Csy2 [Gammaproteobacteria bacterium]